MKTLHYIISAAFCTLVVMSNLISAKMAALPWIELTIPAGLITYPLTFLLADLMTEFFGAKEAKRMVYVALAMCLLSFSVIQIALALPAVNKQEEEAFQAVLGLSGLRIFSSLVAYVIAQVADVQIYALIKKWTGDRFLWLRNNGATCLSQLLDTVVVDLIFLYWGLEMGMSEVFPIMVFSYAYKAAFSFALTPLFYACVFWIRKKDHLSTAKI